MANTDVSGKLTGEKTGVLQNRDSTANALSNSRYGSLLPQEAAPAAPPPESVVPDAASPQAPLGQAAQTFEYVTSSTEARYDLAGNLLPAVAMPSSLIASEAESAPPPSSMFAPALPLPAGNVAAGTWPPPPTSPSILDQMQHNTSGQQGDVPLEVARLRWNWGAFFFPVLWLKNHGMTTLAGMIVGALFLLRMLKFVTFVMNPAIYFGLFVVYGIAYFALQLYFGLNGHQAGWRNRRFHDVADFLACQRIWMYWGIGIFVVTNIVLPIMLITAIVGTAGNPAMHQPGSSVSSPGGDTATGFGDGGKSADPASCSVSSGASDRPPPAGGGADGQ